MGLDDLVRDMIGVADTVTADLQAIVTHQAWVATSDEGFPTYGPVISKRALVDWQQKQVRTLQGTEAVSRARVTFLRYEIVDEKDKIVLPDGTTGPILDMSGFVDPGTGVAYVTEVWLG